MPNVINKMIVRQLESSLAGAEGLIFVSLNGLSVAESEALRTSLAESGITIQMVRNRLTRRALGDIGLEPPAEMLVGNVAMVVGGPEQAIQAAKVLQTSEARKQGKILFRGGLLEGNLLGPDEAGELAKLPGKDELRAMMLGVVSGPARQLVGLLAAPSGALARVLQAHVDAQGGGEDQGEAG